MSNPLEKPSIEVDIDEPAAGFDSSRTYFNYMARQKLLTAEEEVELSKTIEAGLFAHNLIEQYADGQSDRLDELSSAHGISTSELIDELNVLSEQGEAARERFVEANLRLVVKFAYRYQGRGLSLEDLIQEGNAGLIHAVKLFNYQKGFKFSTYASNWIKQAMSRAIADKGRSIRIPVHALEQVNKVKRKRADFIAENGRYPNEDELSVLLSLPIKKISELLEHAREIDSLDRQIGDGDTTIGDLTSMPNLESHQDSVVNSELRRRFLSRINGMLTEREYAVVVLRNGFDGETMTLANIGVIFGVTREMIRQVEKKAYAKLMSSPDVKAMLIAMREG